MMCALPILFFGAVTFAAQDLPDLAVELTSTEGGFAHRLADLDGNDQPDLILPSGVFFQLNGAYSESTTAPAPCNGEPAACDIWNGTIYLRMLGKLRVVRWEGQSWRIQFEQAMDWPDRDSEPALSVYATDTSLRFERFLHDIDGDGTPEIVLPTERGLCIMRAAIGGYYQNSAELDLFPPLQLAQVAGRKLWPESERGITFPARLMNCRYNLNRNEVTVITREEAQSQAQYRVKRFVVDPNGLFILPDQTREETTPPFPPHLQFMRLNDDSVLDIGGGDWQVADSAPLPTPIYETRVSTDAGNTFRTIRVAGFRPHQSFVDINHDGRSDLVTESTGLFEGGLRESLSRFCTSNRFEHEVEVFLQDSSNQFGRDAAVSGAFQIELEAAPIRGGVMFSRYQSGELVNLAGDFNGDGWNDAVVQDKPGRLALYCGGPYRFERRPSATIPLEPSARFGVADYNGDGHSDVAVHWYDAGDLSARLRTKIYLTREGAK